MLKPIRSTQFKKDFKKVVSRGLDAERLFCVIQLLLEEQQLPRELKDHELTGNLKGKRMSYSA